MTVWFGATPADYVTGGNTFAVYTDQALTAPATGIVNEDGDATSNVVTARPSGYARFGAPEGTKVLYTSDGDGSFLRLLPDADLAYPSAVDAVLTGTPTANGSPLVTEEGLAEDGTVIAAVAALAQSNAGIPLARPLPFTKYPDTAALLGDADGNESQLGFRTNGELAGETLDSAVRQGVVRVLAGDAAGLVLVDSTIGERFALGFDDTGQFDRVTEMALANLQHKYIGPDQPYVWPQQPGGSGGFIYWTKTNEKGDIVKRYRVRNVP